MKNGLALLFGVCLAACGGPPSSPGPARLGADSTIIVLLDSARDLARMGAHERSMAITPQRSMPSSTPCAGRSWAATITARPACSTI